MTVDAHPPAGVSAARGLLFALLVLGLLSMGGVVGLAQIAQTGSAADWGYVATTEAFVLSTAAAAPPLALISRLGRGLWGVPARRLAELFGLGALVCIPLDSLLLRQLPNWQARPGIWLDWPGAPGVWHAAGLILLALAGLALVWVSALPDRRAWRGTPQQWYVVGLGLKTLGAVYAMLLLFAHLLVTSDLAMSLVPGWQSANFPASHAVAGLQGGIATVVVGLAVLRRRGTRVPSDVFHACGKLLLALALLWFYFNWSEFLTYWYGRTPAEQGLIALLMARPLYAGAALGCCGLPFLVLLWNRPRASVAGVTLAATLTLIGTLLDQARVFVPAWLVAGPVQERLEVLPEPSAPSLADLLVLVGLPALVLLLVTLVARAVAPIAAWEEREADLLRAEQPYLRTRVQVIGRPG